MGMEDVLLARIVPGVITALTLVKIVRTSQRSQLATRMDAGESRFGIRRAELALFHRSGQLLGNALKPLLSARQIDVTQDHIIASLRADLRNPRAHLTSADDANGLNVGHANVLA